MRDKSTRPKNFGPLLDKLLKVHTQGIEMVRDNKIIPERAESVKGFFIGAFRMLYTVNYSIGSNKEIIRNIVLNIIDLFENGFHWRGQERGHGKYDEVVWLISMAILCDLDIADFKRITKIITRDNMNDKLLNFLIKSRQADWDMRSAEFIQDPPYSKLSRAIDETDAGTGINLLQNYLRPNVWYAGHKDAGWYDAHERTETNTYCGYWAWEAAALAKVKGWDDEKLKNTDYYPYDAVHW